MSRRWRHLCQTHDEGVLRPLGGVVQPDGLRLHVALDHILTALTTETTVLHAAEWSHEAQGSIGVYPDRSGLKSLRHAECPSHVLGPDARREPVLRVVGDPQSISLSVKRDD